MPKFWTFNTGSDNDDSPYGLGLGHQLYWPTFFKRNGLKFWLTFLGKFGGPTAIGKLPGAMIDDPIKRADVLAALKAIQSDSAVVIPEELNAYQQCAVSSPVALLVPNWSRRSAEQSVSAACALPEAAAAVRT